MTEQRVATGPPIAMDRPAGQPVGLPKEGNTRIVEMPQGKPRHDQVREPTSRPIPSPQEEQPTRPVPPAPPKTKPSAELAESSDEAEGTAPASRLAPRRKILAVGAGGGGIGVPLSVILTYYLPDVPNDVAVAYSGLLVAGLSFLAGYLTPAEGD